MSKKRWTASMVRQVFLDYFRAKGHAGGGSETHERS
jgi:alanyl-tRNA synthetase